MVPLQKKSCNYHECKNKLFCCLNWLFCVCGNNANNMDCVIVKCLIDIGLQFFPMLMDIRLDTCLLFVINDSEYELLLCTPKEVPAYFSCNSNLEPP